MLLVPARAAPTNRNSEQLTSKKAKHLQFEDNIDDTRATA